MISFSNISKYFHGSYILQNATFSLSEKDRTGLIGPNGSGKTTLLRMLNGEEETDEGTINKPQSLTIGYLPQEIEVFDGKTALDIVLYPFKHLLTFEKQMQEFGETSNNKSHNETLKRIDQLQTSMEIHDGFSLESRAESILSGLGLLPEEWQLPIRQLSGGYRMRAVLGQLLLCAPDYLLLDEPTNHLDIDSLIWLEKYLLRLRSGMLIVSHDRDFLNRITTTTAGISGTSVTVTPGNYNQYEQLREQNLQNAESRARNLATQIEQNERFVERFKAKATKATQAQSRIKKLGKLREEMAAIPLEQKQQSIRFTFQQPTQSGTVPFALETVAMAYDEKNVFSGLSLTVNRGDKIAIVGPNGAGKTTLLKLLAGILQPSSGSLRIGTNVIIKYFGQHQLDQLHPETTVYDTVRNDAVSTDRTFIRNILGSFLFSGDAVEKKTGVLSGGEKARLVLATILASPGNVLLLDEPTNHLDIPSIEMLSDAMASFAGTIIFISHDEYFISRIATRIIEMRPGMIRDFPGTLEDYRYYLETTGESIGQNPGNDSTPSSDKTHNKEKRKRILDRNARKTLQRTIEKIERTINEHEKKLEGFTAVLEDPGNALDHDLLHQTTLKQQETEKQLEECMEEWEKTHLELEDI